LHLSKKICYISRFFKKKNVNVPENRELMKNSDQGLLIITSKFKKGIVKAPDDTRPYSCLVCQPLVGFLEVCGYKTTYIEGELWIKQTIWNHCWLELEDGRILDPTADQFNDYIDHVMPGIYIGKKPTYYEVINRPK
jgi:hypothetical protein